MLYSFATLMTVILIAEIGVSIAIIIYKGKAYQIVSDSMQMGLDKYKVTGSEGVTKGWDEIQEHFKCCGVDNPSDWKNRPFQQTATDRAPDSCCKIESEGCGKQKLVDPYTDLYNEGCLKKFQGFVESKVFLVGGVGIAIVVVQAIFLIGACCLAKKAKDDGYYA